MPLDSEPEAIIHFLRPQDESDKYYVHCQSPHSLLPYLSRYEHPKEIAEEFHRIGLRSDDFPVEAQHLRLHLKVLEASEKRRLSANANRNGIAINPSLPQGIPALVLRSELAKVMDLAAIEKHPAVRAATCRERRARLRGGDSTQFQSVIDMHSLWARLNSDSRELIRKKAGTLTPLLEETAEFKTLQP